MDFELIKHKIKLIINPFLSFDRKLKSSNLFDIKNEFDGFEINPDIKTPQHISLTFKKYIFSKNGDSVVVI